LAAADRYTAGGWWSKNGKNCFLEKDQIGVDLRKNNVVKFCLLAGFPFCHLKIGVVAIQSNCRLIINKCRFLHTIFYNQKLVKFGYKVLGKNVLPKLVLHVT
jgi:hypothetical protein